MSNVEKKKNKKRLSSSQLAIVIGLVIIAIPVAIFAGILGISWLQTGSPRNGDRFKNDLNPTITSQDVKSLESDLASISNVEKVEVICEQGQLRIYIDCSDSLNSESVDTLLVNAYNKVNSNLSINTYFTSTDSKKMYDLLINVYTTSENVENREYKVLHKNASEEVYGIDDLAHPKDEKLVAELYQELEDTNNEE